MDFKLESYIEPIKAIARHNNVSASTAVDQFVTNLIIMREHYKGAPELNYHTLGQQWNSLLSDEKIRQKNEVLKLVSTETRGTRRNREDL